MTFIKINIIDFTHALRKVELSKLKMFKKRITSSNQRLLRRVRRFPAEVSPEKSNRWGQTVVRTPKKSQIFLHARHRATNTKLGLGSSNAIIRWKK